MSQYIYSYPRDEKVYHISSLNLEFQETKQFNWWSKTVGFDHNVKFFSTVLAEECSGNTEVGLEKSDLAAHLALLCI